ncbi:MAG: lactate utilization protein [Euryarchaeota archaeon]|nr:lactate utilization protein [Euryarchaeota archaeon]
MNKSKLKTMRESFHILEERRNNLMEYEATKKLMDRVKKIRENSISNLDNLIKTAKTNFETNGIDFIFAEDSKKALSEIYKLVKDETVVAKSKSNTIFEIGLTTFLEDKEIEVVETDMGDRIVQLDPESRAPSHPIGPASHLNVEDIAQIVSEKFIVEIEPDPHAIIKVIKTDIINELSHCKIGITGANSIAAEDGSIILVHNEGNISLLSMQDLHIVVVGIDKLVRTIEDAISVVKLETIFATGTTVPAYMNVISSPSKTADIEQVLIEDMYGAKKVVVIMIDNGRSEASKKCRECLLCIGCGSCVVSCPVYNAVGYDFGYRGYLGGRGIALSRFIENEKTCFEGGLFFCTLCGLCTLDCPVEVPTNEMIEKLREDSVKSGFFHKKHYDIVKKIKKTGQPF